MTNVNKKKELIGLKFGKLTVLEYGGVDNYRNRRWICKCDCGNDVIVRGYYLKNNRTNSCGCLSKTHGMTNTPTYITWASMLNRCYNKKAENYIYYGDRGIVVCDEWKKSFESFYEDMGEKPKGMSLDRIDNNGNYCKENCKWSTIKEQSNNKRNTVISFFNQNEWPYAATTVRRKLNNGMTREQIIEEAKINVSTKGRHWRHVEMKLNEMKN